MKINIANNIKQKTKADYLVLPFIEDKNEPIALFTFKEYDSIVKTPIKTKDFLIKNSVTKIRCVSLAPMYRESLLYIINITILLNL